MTYMFKYATSALLLLICLFQKSFSKTKPHPRGVEARGIGSHKFVESFCQSKNYTHETGYAHPYFCSKYIECAIRESDQKHIGKERTCQKCYDSQALGRFPTKEEMEACPYGYWQYNAEQQACVPPSTSTCKQSEMKTKGMVWGELALARVCDRAEGSGYYPHPTRCSYYVYCEFNDKYEDLHVKIFQCNTCNKKNGGCRIPTPMHYVGDGKCRPTKACLSQSPMVETAGSSQDGKDESDTDNEEPTNPIGESKEVVQPKGNSEEANQFCATQQPVTARYPHPRDCERYFTCNFKAFHGQNGTFVVSDHYEIACPACLDKNRCKGVKRLHFDSRSLLCTYPDKTTCGKST